MKVDEREDLENSDNLIGGAVGVSFDLLTRRLRSIVWNYPLQFKTFEAPSISDYIDSTVGFSSGVRSDEKTFLSGYDVISGGLKPDSFHVFGVNNVIVGFSSNKDEVTLYVEEVLLRNRKTIMQAIELDVQDGGLSILVQGREKLFLDRVQELALGVTDGSTGNMLTLSTPGNENPQSGRILGIHLPTFDED